MNLPTHLCENCGQPSSRPRRGPLNAPELCHRCACAFDDCERPAAVRLSIDGVLQPMCEEHRAQFQARVSMLSVEYRP